MAQETPTTANPLFYRSIVPLDREKHRLARMARPERPYAFAERTQFIPAVVDEFVAACRELAIVFMPGVAQANAVFIVGLSGGQNMLVTPSGEWEGSYVPAFVRRYPFIRGDVEGKDPVICIDPTFEGLNEKDGEAIFDGEEQTAYLQAQVGFVNAYFEASRRSDEFMATLQRLDLLKSVSIDVKTAGNAVALHGLLAVDEEKLNALPGKEFEKIRKAGWLPAIYAHLISLGAISRLSAKLETKRKGLDA